MIKKPLYTQRINGRPLRFFKIPIDDGRPDFPWHSFEDLMSAAKLPQAMLESFLRDARRDYPNQVRTIATADGVTTVAPHPHAQGFLAAAVDAKLLKKAAISEHLPGSGHPRVRRRGPPSVGPTRQGHRSRDLMHCDGTCARSGPLRARSVGKPFTINLEIDDDHEPDTHRHGQRDPGPILQDAVERREA